MIKNKDFRSWRIVSIMSYGQRRMIMVMNICGMETKWQQIT